MIDPGPYYDDLLPGHVFPSPPGITVDDGLAAAYLGIAGDGLPLALDGALCRAVTGRVERLVNPALVMHLSVGATTVATKKVIANLFYRNVVIRRPVFMGETLRTTTRVLAMADARLKPGTVPRGKVVLGIETVVAGCAGDVGDGVGGDDGETVVALERCPLLPCRGDELPGHDDAIGGADSMVELDAFRVGVPSDWDLGPLGPSDAWAVGEQRIDPLRDVVDGATSLVRLTQNLAAAHRDVDASPYDRRLVYGGHTFAIGQASLSRVLGGLATVVGWQWCNHVAPVFEGDVLSCHHTLLSAEPGRLDDVAAGRLMAVQVEVFAHRSGDEPVKVLDWVPICLTS